MGEQQDATLVQLGGGSLTSVGPGTLKPLNILGGFFREYHRNWPINQLQGKESSSPTAGSLIVEKGGTVGSKASRKVTSHRVSHIEIMNY